MFKQTYILFNKTQQKINKIYKNAKLTEVIIKCVTLFHYNNIDRCLSNNQKSIRI